MPRRASEVSELSLPIPGLRWGDYPERTEPIGVKAAGRPRDGELPWRRGMQSGRFVRAVREHEARLRAMSADDRAAQLRDTRIALRRDGLVDSTLAVAFAHAGLACEERLGTLPFDTQLIAARHVAAGRLAEMATGEGKTLTVALAAASAALAGIPLQVVTANDYLAARDAAQLQPVYDALGLTVGCVTQPLTAAARRAAYAFDIVYCTASELVFDYLRDGLSRKRDPLQAQIDRLAGPGDARPFEAPLLRGLCMAIVDEADSVLIDEARVPLILSAATAVDPAHAAFLAEALVLAARLTEGSDFRLDGPAARLTAAGAERVAGESAALGAVWQHRLHREDTVQLALAALHAFRRERHYLVANGRLQIVDETSGRVAAGRAWSRGLHQLIELKEGLEPTAPAVTVAQITYQRFFARYLRLGGLSGTLAESRRELRAVYGLAVAAVPLRRPSRRETGPTRWFADRAVLFDAVVARVQALQAAGRPVLVGVESVADAAQLSARLTTAAIGHSRLDAQRDAQEAEVVARAGRAGAVTVSTQMAGRGTDIALGPGVAERGGLHLINCQLNAARRIDRQLAGRCARQGDPGSVETWLSLDAALLAELPAALRALLAHHAGRLPDRACRTLGSTLQRLREARDAAQRRQLLHNDRQLDRRLSFATRR